MQFFKDDNRRKALIGTLLFHLFLSLLFLFLGLKTPVPPPEEHRVAIAMDLGTHTQGSGQVDAQIPDQEQPVQNQEQVEEVSESSVSEEAVTQETSSPAVSSEKQQEQEQQPVEKEEPKVSKELQDALDQFKNQESGGGNDGQGEDVGDKGDPKGTPEGSGSLGGGNGNWRLAGRKIVQKPRPDKPRNEEGKVVLNIWVDRNGNVIRTSPNLAKSNTTSEQLFKLAEEAALEARFNDTPNAAPVQKGEMIFTFLLE